MKIWNGHFDKKHNPCIRIQVAGDTGRSIEIEAVIDTGFSGFLLVPVYLALPLGLAYVATSKVNLADGSDRPMLLGMAEVTFQETKKMGLVHLPGPSTDALVGLDFLRQFGLALYVSSSLVGLVDEQDLIRVTQANQGPPVPPKK